MEQVMNLLLNHGPLGIIAVVEMLLLKALFQRMEAQQAAFALEREKFHKEVSDLRDRYDAKSDKDKEKNEAVAQRLFAIIDKGRAT